jgi:F-type H+-transporting ATPase subunit gamma
MKALAASSVGQYEKSVTALADYYKTVELGLGVCFRQMPREPDVPERKAQQVDGSLEAIVFGSDQGLVGQFNEVIADFAITTMAALPGKPTVWAVGERVYSRLADAPLSVAGQLKVPNSVKGIGPLIGKILTGRDARRDKDVRSRVYVFHNRPLSGAQFEPVGKRLLPLDAPWQKGLIDSVWPTKSPPEILSGSATLRALIGEYLFISLFQACAESLASENASRLSAMERADKNIVDLLDDLGGQFHRLRQSDIDEELFDVVSGFEASEPATKGS